MKKAFTMIELIFVIVILGILAAVAIPRLAATRDDAEMSKAAANLATFVKDVSAYYTSQGNFSPKIADMTNVLVVNNTGADESSAANEMFLQVKKALCFKIELGENKIYYDGATGTQTGSSFEGSAGDEDAVKNDADAIQITAVALGKGSKICKEVFSLPAIRTIMTAKEIEADTTTKVFNVGGTGVVYSAYDIFGGEHE